MSANYSRGLACKVSGYASSDVGFVLSAAEMKRLGEVRDSITEAGKGARHAGNLVAAGLGAVALGLVVSALAGGER